MRRGHAGAAHERRRGAATDTCREDVAAGREDVDWSAVVGVGGARVILVGCSDGAGAGLRARGVVRCFAACGGGKEERVLAFDAFLFWFGSQALEKGGRGRGRGMDKR